jgi:acetaldehyde dehydrogenase (acetylating)
MDKDLTSIQEARELANAARQAQLAWAHATQEQVDKVCAAMAEAVFQSAERIGRMAVEETGYGVPQHKKLKNEFGSRNVWESIRDVKTVGVVNHDTQRKIYEIAWPVGVVCALTPSTNPTSTAAFKALISVKARDAIVVAPHPSAVQCSYETIAVMAAAAETAGAPKGLVSCMQNISLPGTQELMNHKYVALILATGGTPMVKAAHSVGKPAFGVGPGNVPVYVDRSADIVKAARYIVASKAFDYSTICATEQSVIADQPIAAQLEKLCKENGAYFVDENQANALRKLLFSGEGAIDPKTVGKSPQVLAGMAGFSVPTNARILVARLSKTGREEPLSREKLTTVLGWYVENGWEAGCDRSIELIQFGGRGHTQIIHATDEKVILEFGLQKPVFRILVNTMGTLGAIGLTTGVMPSLTLGAGGVGGSITGDNISVQHMFNIKRLAYETMPPPAAAFLGGESATSAPSIDVDNIVKAVFEEVLKM